MTDALMTKIVERFKRDVQDVCQVKGPEHVKSQRKDKIMNW